MKQNVEINCLWGKVFSFPNSCWDKEVKVFLFNESLLSFCFEQKPGGFNFITKREKLNDFYLSFLPLSRTTLSIGGRSNLKCNWGTLHMCGTKKIRDWKLQASGLSSVTWPNRSGCLDWRVGGQPNLGNACILGTFGPAAHPLCCDATHFLSERSSLAWCGKRYIFLNRRDFYHLKTVYNPAIYCLCRWLIYLGDLVKADLPSGDFEAGAHAKKKSCWSDTAAWQRGRESRLQIKCSCKCWRWQDHRIQSSPPAPLLPNP